MDRILNNVSTNALGTGTAEDRISEVLLQKEEPLSAKTSSGELLLNWFSLGQLIQKQTNFSFQNFYFSITNKYIK